MNPPFYRACRMHGGELEDRTENAGYGPEVLWCKSGHGGGHRCRSWEVRDNVGEVLAVAYTSKKPMIMSIDLLGFQFGKPKRRCQNGHYEWKENKEGIYICVPCEEKTRAEKQARKAAEVERLKRQAQARLLKRAAALEKAREKLKQVKSKRTAGTWRVMRGLDTLRKQVEQRRIERALKIVNNRIAKEK